MLKGLENIELHLLRNIPASFHHRLYQAYHNHSINVVRQYRSSMQHYNFCCLNKDTSNQNDHSNSYQYTYLSNTIDNKRSIDQIRVILSYTLENSEGAIKNG